MEYFEKVAAYEDAIIEKVAMSDAMKRKIKRSLVGASAVGTGAMSGALIGGGSGALYGLLKKKTDKDRDEQGNELSRGDIVRKYTKCGLGEGALAGGILGACDMVSRRRNAANNAAIYEKVFDNPYYKMFTE